MNRIPIAVLASLALCATLFAAEERPMSPVKEKEFKLPGGTSDDRMAIDSATDRLYVAHSGVVDVVDIGKGEKVGTIDNVDRAHGVALVPELKRGFASAGKNNKLVVFDLETLKTVKLVSTGDNPDAVLYVSTTKEIWVFCQGSTEVTVVDPSTLEEKKPTIKLEGKPESAVENPSKATVYVNIIGEHSDGVCAIEARPRKVSEVHSLQPGVEPTGLAIHLKTGMLFAGCLNRQLVILDSVKWKVVAHYETGEFCQGVAFDPATQNIFASSFTITRVVHMFPPNAKDKFLVLTSLQTPGGKTCVLDPKTHRVVVATGPKPKEEGEVKVLTFLPPAK